MSHRILLTGCRGQLGRDLADHLGGGHEVVGFDVDDFDIRDTSAVNRAFAQSEPTAVLHAAAYTDVDGCESDREMAMSVNAEATGVIARACRDHGARMIYYSTDYVFDGCKSGPYVESDATNPQTVYGLSKLEGEREIAANLDDYVIMRIAWVYGLRGKNFVRTMIHLAHEQIGKAKRGEIIEPLRVVDDQIGNPCWTIDIVRQTARILQSDLTGVVHATSEGVVSWYEFACEIFRLLDLPVQISPCSSAQFPRPAPRPANSTLENGRLSDLGLNIMPPWSESLKLFLTSYHTESAK